MNRRSFTRASVHATSFGLVSLLLPRPQASTVAAESLKTLDHSHPAAQALKYVEEAASADPAVYPADGQQNCASCTHYKGGANSSGGCALFPGFRVQSSGWCTGWVAE